MRRLRVLTLVSVLLSLPSWAEQALTLDQRKLIGISAYYVTVEELKPAAVHCGITEQQLKTQAELALRKNGIPVTSGAPDTLYVRLTILFDAPLRSCFFFLETQVKEFVQRD